MPQTSYKVARLQAGAPVQANDIGQTALHRFADQPAVETGRGLMNTVSGTEKEND